MTATAENKPLRERTHRRYGRDRKCPGCGGEQMFIREPGRLNGLWLCRDDECGRQDEYVLPDETIDGEEMCICGRGPVVEDGDGIYGVDDECAKCLEETFVPMNK